MFIYGKLLMV